MNLLAWNPADEVLKQAPGIRCYHPAERLRSCEEAQDKKAQSTKEAQLAVRKKENEDSHLSWGNRPLLIGPAAESCHRWSGRGRKVKRGFGCRRLPRLHHSKGGKKSSRNRLFTPNPRTPATALLSRGRPGFTVEDTSRTSGKLFWTLSVKETHSICCFAPTRAELLSLVGVSVQENLLISLFLLVTPRALLFNRENHFRK